jgi:hypothetical protein
MQALPASQWRNKKMQEVQLIIEACSGLFVEATTQQEYIVQGDSLKATFFLNNRKGVKASLKKIEMENMDSAFSTMLQPNTNFSFNKTFYVAENKSLTQPYWLQEPQEKGMFVVTNQTLIGNAETRPAYEVNFTVNIEGTNFIIPKSVQYKYVDPVKGELYQPLQVLPIATIDVDDNEKMVKENDSVGVLTKVRCYKPNQKLYINFKGLDVTLNHLRPTALELKNNLHETFWSYKNTDRSFEFFLSDNPQEINPKSNTLHQIKYDHIPTITYFTQAKLNTHKLDVKTVGKKIGYIVGAGDKVPQALEQLGYDIDILTEKDITLQSKNELFRFTNFASKILKN